MKYEVNTNCQRTNVREIDRRSRKLFGDHKQEHSKRKQHRDLKGNLFARLWGKHETKGRHRRRQDTGKQDAHDVEQRLPFDFEGECNIWIRIRAALIIQDVPLRFHRDHVPFIVKDQVC